MKCNNMWLYALQKNPQELKFYVLWKDYNYDILKEKDKLEFIFELYLQLLFIKI